MWKIWNNSLEVTNLKCYNESDSVLLTLWPGKLNEYLEKKFSKRNKSWNYYVTYRVHDACIGEREFHSTFFKSVGKNNFISVIWIFCKSTTSWHCCCCPVVISHDTFIHTNHLKRRRKTCLDIFWNFSPCCQHYRWLWAYQPLVSKIVHRHQGSSRLDIRKRVRQQSHCNCGSTSHCSHSNWSPQELK